MKVHVLENNNETFSVLILEGQAIVVDAGNSDFITGDKLSESMVMSSFKHIKSFDVTDECVNIKESPCDTCEYMLCA